VIYDSMRYFYWPAIAGRVHVAEPYLLERSWFGIGGRTPNEWFLEHHWPALEQRGQRGVGGHAIVKTIGGKPDVVAA